MIEPSTIASQMANCSAMNGYAGLDNLKRLANSDSDSAWSIIWNILTKKEDPGFDDGILCFELLRLAASTLGRDHVEQKILLAWNNLDTTIHRNMIHGFEDKSTFSLNFARDIFDQATTTVRIRNHIVAILASCRHDEATTTCLDLAPQIGSYKDPQRQQTLNRFLNSLYSSYE